MLLKSIFITTYIFCLYTYCTDPANVISVARNCRSNKFCIHIAELNQKRGRKGAGEWLKRFQGWRSASSVWIEFDHFWFAPQYVIGNGATDKDIRVIDIELNNFSASNKLGSWFHSRLWPHPALWKSSLPQSLSSFCSVAHTTGTLLDPRKRQCTQ